VPWPEVLFIGDYPNIVNRLAHSRDFAPHDLMVVTRELADAPDRPSPDTVAVFTDQWDIRERYVGVPTLCHKRLADHHRHLGKWSVSFRGTGLDSGDDSLESGAAHVSDDNEARQFGVLFLLAAIEQSLRSERPGVSPAERQGIRSLSRRISSYLGRDVLTGDAADALRLSAAALRLEMRNPRPDRMIIRRALARIDHLSVLFAAGSNGNVIKTQLSDLIRSFRSPLIESDEPTPTIAEAEA
jgi:hypothetical protein